MFVYKMDLKFCGLSLKCALFKNHALMNDDVTKRSLFIKEQDVLDQNEQTDACVWL